MLAVAIGKENKSERNTHGTKMKRLLKIRWSYKPKILSDVTSFYCF